MTTCDDLNAVAARVLAMACGTTDAALGMPLFGVADAARVDVAVGATVDADMVAAGIVGAVADATLDDDCALFVGAT